MISAHQHARPFLGVYVLLNLMTKPKLLETTKIYDGKVFDVTRARIEDNGLVYEREIINHHGSAVVLPLHSNGDITLVKQYRHAAREYLLEIPAGTVEKGESPEQCAHREIEEETGFKAAEMKKISEFYVSPGFLTEKMHLYVASDLNKTRQNLDDDENIDLVTMHLDEALALVNDGTIEDAKTIIGILIVASTQNTDRQSAPTP